MNNFPTSKASLRVSGLLLQLFVLSFALLLLAVQVSASGSNVLVNGDFESNPPPNLGNNIGWSIAPWVLGTGNQSNVVKVDGVYNYSNNGPWRDASASAVGVKRHYLDIADGQNDFYQTFTPPCEGEVDFGGFFSTRANSAGSAWVKIVMGTGTSGAVVGTTNTINLPGGNSATDPWTPVAYTANLVAGQTYSFVVHMDNNMNFDEAYVRYKTDCNVSPTPTPTPTSTPVASGCAQVTGDIRCLPNGGYSYTFTVKNNSGKPMSQILLTPVQGSSFTLSPQLTNLGSPLASGQSTTVATTIGGAKPGDKVCFFVSLMSDKDACCIVQVCLTMPQCGDISPTPPPPPARQLPRGKGRP
jgi:hypothetical protein